MLLASVRAPVFAYFFKSTDELNVDGFNDFFSDAQDLINSMIEKLTSQGIKMNSIFLKKANSIEDIISVYNYNISKINEALLEINKNVGNFNFKLDDGEVMSVNFKNNFLSGKIVVGSDDVEINYTNSSNESKTVTILSDGDVNVEDS